jgi:23S rRNA pseudouridine1911/1915/1917 synthase
MLKFAHPTSGNEMQWQAPIPDDMAELTKMLRADTAERGMDY